MATGTSELREMIERNLRPRDWFVALVAGDGDMPASERKAGLLVFRERVVRCLECRARMALVATITPGFSGELSLMFVGVAIDALREFDLEPGTRASRHMTRGALHLGMRKREWESSLGMVRDGKC